MSWQVVPQEDCPAWLLLTLGNNALQSAGEKRRLLVRADKRFSYKVTPQLQSDGQWVIARIERRPRRRKTRPTRPQAPSGGVHD